MRRIDSAGGKLSDAGALNRDHSVTGLRGQSYGPLEDGAGLDFNRVAGLRPVDCRLKIVALLDYDFRAGCGRAVHSPGEHPGATHNRRQQQRQKNARKNNYLHSVTSIKYQPQKGT